MLSLDQPGSAWGEIPGISNFGARGRRTRLEWRRTCLEWTLPPARNTLTPLGRLVRVGRAKGERGQELRFEYRGLSLLFSFSKSEITLPVCALPALPQEKVLGVIRDIVSPSVTS